MVEEPGYSGPRSPADPEEDQEDHKGNAEIGQNPPEACDEALNAFERNARVRLHGVISILVTCTVLAERVQVQGVPARLFNQSWFEASGSVGDKPKVPVIL